MLLLEAKGVIPEEQQDVLESVCQRSDLESVLRKGNTVILQYCTFTDHFLRTLVVILPYISGLILADSC